MRQWFVRVAATILQRVDNLEAALTPCKLCLEEFHCIPYVKEKFEEICDNHKAGQRMSGGLEIISTVHQVNRLIYDVTQTVGKDAHIWIWPSVAVTQRLPGVLPINGDNKVGPLRDVRVTKPLQDLGMQDCSVTLWSFGQEGDEDHKLLGPHSICTNRKGHFIVSDYRANEIKVFDKGGKFLKKFCTPSPTHICDVVTDRNGNIYTLSYLLKREANEMEYTTELTLTVYDKETHLQRTSSHLLVKRNWCGFNELHSYLAVSDSSKMFLLNGIRGKKTRGGYRVNYLVDVYSTDGQFVCSFGEEKIKSASAIVTDNDARVMILEMSSVRVFSEQGDQIFGFSICGPGPSEESKITFHRESEYVVVVQKDRSKDILRVQIYAKNGKFVREIYLRGEKIHWVRGMTVTDDGHVAISYGDLRSPYGKVTVV